MRSAKIGAIGVPLLAALAVSGPARPATEEGGGQRYEIVIGTDPCEVDADCVPAACCHSRACVSRDKAPTGCGDALCTMSCEPGTIDCYGGCLCRGGRCAARLWLGRAGGEP